MSYAKQPFHIAKMSDEVLINYGSKILFIDLWEMLHLKTHFSQILWLNKTYLLCSQDVCLSSLSEGLYPCFRGRGGMVVRWLKYNNMLMYPSGLVCLAS